MPVEPDPATHNITAAAVEAAITPRTKAIMPVHLYGQPADMDESRRSGATAASRSSRTPRRRRAPAIAAAVRARLGDAAGFSFYPGKNLGALGDAGAVTTDDDALAERVRMLRNYGSKVKYHHDVPGLNSRLDSLQAAFLRIKLRHLDEWNERRRAVAARYLSGSPGVGELVAADGGRVGRPRLAPVRRAPSTARRAAGPPRRRPESTRSSTTPSHRT